MELSAVQSAIESILFAMGNSVEIAKIAEVLEVESALVEDALDAMEERYKADECGVQLVRLEDSVQLCTKPENYDHLIKITKAKPKFSLSDTVLETLSIIAYKQPVTRIEIEKIRGVSCEHAVNKLLEYDLIKEFGRLDAPGKPILFGTTENFLRCFGVTSISDLPQITPDQVEEYKKEAEAEISVKLDI
ncbi:MAG: SMC-Scp complex subunit ScpB [Lachnospiraceae bacterium]|jgi:segregation and condensation protein B|nr:SMC-Scp complex subunit ScpB [Lachnospiraceae bacterium]